MSLAAAVLGGGLATSVAGARSLEKWRKMDKSAKVISVQSNSNDAIMKIAKYFDEWRKLMIINAINEMIAEIR